MTELTGTVLAPPSILTQVAYLALALGLTGIIGLDRQIRDKSAGLRTHSVIGLGAALFVLLSKYGFFDVLSGQKVVLDPSRVAAQIASGIGFVGAGLIFVRRGDVKGLTSAAAVWLTAAIGAVAGAGLVVVACLGTAGYFVIAIFLTSFERFLYQFRTDSFELTVVYRGGAGVLARTFELCEDQGFDRLATTATEQTRPADGASAMFEARIVLRGRGSAHTLVALLHDLPGIEAVVTTA